MIKPALIALLLSGCTADTAPLEINLNYLPHLRKHSGDVMEDAQEYLGAEFKMYAGQGGGIVVFVHEPVDGFKGYTDWVHPCSPVIWATDEAKTLAHEIGHALDLEHIQNQDNLMSNSSWGTELTIEQIEIMRSNTERLEKCKH